MPRSNFARMLVKFCQQRASTVLSPDDAGRLQSYLLDLLADQEPAPKSHGDYDWETISIACGIELAQLRGAARTLAPGLDALGREVAKAGQPKRLQSPLANWRRLEANSPARASRWGLDSPKVQSTQKRGPKPKPIVEFPEPDGQSWTDPASFAEAFDLHMRRHGDSAQHLAKALSATARHIDVQTIIVWRRGLKVPSTSRSLEGLELIEKRYRLPAGYFRAKLPITDRCISVGAIDGVGPAERRRLAWHLPADFDRRPRDERKEILEWVKRVVITGATEYRRFQAAAMRQRYAVRFPGVLGEPVAGVTCTGSAAMKTVPCPIPI